MPDFVINLGRHEHKIQEKLQKINNNQNNLKLFKTTVVHLRVYSGKVWNFFFVLHTLTCS